MNIDDTLDFDYLRALGATLEGPRLAELEQLLAVYVDRMSLIDGWAEGLDKDVQEMAQKIGISPSQARTFRLVAYWLGGQWDGSAQTFQTEAAQWLLGQASPAFQKIWGKWGRSVVAIKVAAVWKWGYCVSLRKSKVDPVANEQQLLEATQFQAKRLRQG